jgi:putative FmdB family regulatory protein
MATYEYQCKSCSEKFEIQRSIGGEDTEVKCPKCGSIEVERVYFSFNQSGSYDNTMSNLGMLRRRRT